MIAMLKMMAMESRAARLNKRSKYSNDGRKSRRL